MLLLIIASAFWDEKGNIGLEEKKIYGSQSHVIDFSGDFVAVKTSTDINERIPKSTEINNHMKEQYI